MHQDSDFNPAVDELQRIYNFSQVIERIAFNATAESGPLLSIA